VECGLVYTQCKWEEELVSFLRLAFQFPDEMFSDAVEAREKTTPTGAYRSKDCLQS